MYSCKEILNKRIIDFSLNEWIIKDYINNGYYGNIFIVKNIDLKKNKIKNKKYILKIEKNKNNLTLKNEIYIYSNYINKENIIKWKKNKNLSFLGILKYYNSGNFLINNTLQKFMIINKKNIDLENYLKINNNKIFDIKKIYKIGHEILNVLEYLFNYKIIHNDINPSNILLGFSEDKIYLSDFGLSFIINSNQSNKLIECGNYLFKSRYSHEKIQNLLSDIESLFYLMILLYNRFLFWDKNFKFNDIYIKKNYLFNNIKSYFEKKNNNKINNLPIELLEFGNLINNIKINNININENHYIHFKKILLKNFS